VSRRRRTATHLQGPSNPVSTDDPQALAAFLAGVTNGPYGLSQFMDASNAVPPEGLCPMVVGGFAESPIRPSPVSAAFRWPVGSSPSGSGFACGCGVVTLRF
jgi:hypothetical protein